MSASTPVSSGPAMFPRLMLLCMTLIVVPTPYFLPSMASMAVMAGVIKALPRENTSLETIKWRNVVDSGNPAIPIALSTPPSIMSVFLSYLSARTPHGCWSNALAICPTDSTIPAIVTDSPSPPSFMELDMYIVRKPKMAPLPMLLTTLNTKLASSSLFVSTFLKLGLTFFLPGICSCFVSGKNIMTITRLTAVPAHMR